MREKTAIIGICTWIALMLPQTGAGAGYEDLKRTFDEYRPPVFLPVKDREKGVPEEGAHETDFVLEKKRIREAVEGWERSLRTGADFPAFLSPDPGLMETLSRIKGDDAAITEMLGRGFSLETIEGLALLRSPGVMAAQEMFQASIEGLRQVTALDEILRRYTAFTEGVSTGVGPMKGRDPIELKFPFPGVLSLKGEIAEQEVRMSREDLEQARRKAVTSVRISYWALLYNLKAQKITSRNLDLFRNLEEVARARYEAGKSSFQDVIKVRIERDILEEDLTTLRELQGNLETQIREILALPRDVRLGPPEERTPREKVPPLQTLYALALERRQELRRLRDKIGKTERMIEMAETMILPSFSLDLSLYEDEAVTQVGTQATKETFPVSIKASRGAGLPKQPWIGIEDAYVRETVRKLQAQRDELRQAELTTTLMVREAWFELDRAIRDESLYRERIVGQARSALDVSTRGYESGNVSFADVISSYTMWLQANLTLEKKRADIGKSWALLEDVLGTTLEH